MRLDEFHIFSLGVEFTNSYQDPLNSTPHFDAHLSGLGLIIDAIKPKSYQKRHKKLPPVEFSLERWKLPLQSGINFYN